MGSYLRPASLDDALAALDHHPRTLIAGATDYFPARVVHSPDDDILDLTGMCGYRAIARQGDMWRIPCLATWTDLIEARLPPMFDGLVTAARQVGGVQIQNAGTVVGNVCNASPAADGVPCLMALDASVELASSAGIRVISLATFVLGARRTARGTREIVTALLVPALPDDTISSFQKLGGRRYLVISIVMLATTARLAADGSIADIRLSIGACSATAQRLTALETALRGRLPDAAAIEHADLAELSPIDDIRGSAAYRRTAALELVRRALRSLGNHAAVAA